MFNLQHPKSTKILELTARDVEDAERLLGMIGRARSSPEASSAQSRQDQAIERATAIVAMRDRRKKFFNASMFGEPAWDVLMALYLTQSQGLTANINMLTRAAGVPPTTALRWIEYLENQQLVAREKHPTDARASIVQLTDKAQQALELYLLETLP